MYLLLFILMILPHVVPVCVTCVLLPQVERAQENEFIECHHMNAGGWKDDTQHVYLRKHAVDEWNKLCQSNKVLHIEGPPGTGKSTIAWAWACFTAQKETVVWVHRKASGRSRIALLGAGYVVYFDFPARLESQLGLILSTCALLARANIIVVDRIVDKRKDLFGDTAAWANESSRRRAVLVTSAQIVFPGHFNRYYNISTFSMPSWTLDQYRQACENNILWCERKTFSHSDD
jgi:ABC-type cobalamin/Fe3+-siderophores transport system ATPase subunit